jgi:DNA repair protein RecO (recombination protein O)
MIVKTRGIVLSTLRYSDSSVIVRIYTEIAGLRSFMVRTGKGKTALLRMSLLQPLGPVEISFDRDEKKNLHVPRSLERDAILKEIPFDTAKTCIALFMAEVVSHSIAEEEMNSKLFEFLHGSVMLLDAETNSVKNFHLKFMIEFSGHLGFFPHQRIEDEAFFDLFEGMFVTHEPLHRHYLQGALVSFFEELMNAPFKQHHQVRIGNENRRQLLQALVDYYRLHLHGMKEINAHKVLEEVLG